MTVWLASGVGIVYFVSRLYEKNKNKKILNDVLLTQKFKVYEYSKWITYVFFMIVILSIISIYIGYLDKSEFNMGLGVLLAFLSLAEAIYSLDITKLYYCEHGCVINNEYIRYKSMKSMHKKSPIPLSKWNLQTFNKAKITINNSVALFIQKNGNIPVVNK